MYTIFLWIYLIVWVGLFVFLGGLIWQWSQDRATIKTNENWQELNRKEKKERDKWVR